MQAREEAEEVAVDGGGVRDAAVAEQQREDRGERGPQHQHGDRGGGARAVQPLDEFATR